MNNELNDKWETMFKEGLPPKTKYTYEIKDGRLIERTEGSNVSHNMTLFDEIVSEERNKVLKEQSTKLWHVSNYLYNKPALELSKMLAEKTFADKVFFSNSGNEANEAAIKLARKYYFDQGKTEKYEIIVLYFIYYNGKYKNV